MRTVVFLLFVVALISRVIKGEEGVVTSDVKVLTEQNFDSELAAGGAWLVEFYAPWCGHCKSLAPKYEELATKVKGKYNIAKVDCTVEKGLQTRFGIRGFPTLKLIKDGTMYDYQGQRTVDAFITFLDTGYLAQEIKSNPVPKAGPPTPAAPKLDVKTGPSDVVTLTFDNFEKLTSEGTWFLEFYAPWCGHCKRLAPIYEEVATQLKGKVHVGKVNCDEEKVVCTQYGIKGYPSVYFKKDNELRDYTSARTVEAFKKFAESDYQQVKAEPVPEPVSAWKIQAYSFLGALENGVGNNLWIVIGACVLVGVILGVVVVSCTSSSTPASKTIHYTATPSSDEKEGEEPAEEEIANKDD